MCVPLSAILRVRLPTDPSLDSTDALVHLRRLWRDAQRHEHHPSVPRRGPLHPQGALTELLAAAQPLKLTLYFLADRDPHRHGEPLLLCHNRASTMAGRPPRCARSATCPCDLSVSRRLAFLLACPAAHRLRLNRLTQLWRRLPQRYRSVQARRCPYVFSVSRPNSVTRSDSRSLTGSCHALLERSPRSSACSSTLTLRSSRT